MNKFVALITLLLGLFWFSPSTCFSQDEEYKIGVLANRGAHQAFREWKATADLLSSQTGKTFTLVPLEYSQFSEWIQDGKLDFVLANSAMYAEFNRLYGIQAIGTQVNQHNGRPMDEFGSVIIVKNESLIKTLSDFKGKPFACASRSAFGGWLMSARVFMENGINPETDLGAVRELKTHDNVVYAVFNGVVAGGSVRTGTLEKMVQEDKVKITDFRIIRQIDDDFPLVHSTRLYPEYPFAACRQVPAALRQQVAKVLIGIPENDPANTSARIAGWKAPLDYGPVVECLSALKYGAFKSNTPSAASAAVPSAPEKIAEGAPATPGPDAGQKKAQPRTQRARAPFKTDGAE